MENVEEQVYIPMPDDLTTTLRRELTHSDGYVYRDPEFYIVTYTVCPHLDAYHGYIGYQKK